MRQLSHGFTLATLIFAASACTSSDTPATEALPAATPNAYEAYPEAIASFGAAVLDDHVYVYSGHIGETHSHSIDNLSTAFRRLEFSDANSRWEDLAFESPVQSNALVAFGGAIYRTGGMTASNRIGEPEALFSTDSYRRYDPAEDAWQELTPLPAYRSSHDAVVVGDILYVMGGWELTGGDSASGTFHAQALRMDLGEDDEEWESFDQPFRRRAVCVAAVGDSIYVIGGITDDGKGSLDVDVYNLVEDSWSVGPDLPGDDAWNGFGCSAFGVNGLVYATGRDGIIRTLPEGGDQWESVGQLSVARFFHRLLPRAGGELLMIGGAAMSGEHLTDIEGFDVR